MTMPQRLRRLLCRFGMHEWMVQWRNQVTPLRTSSMLLALDDGQVIAGARRRCIVFCAHCPVELVDYYTAVETSDA